MSCRHCSAICESDETGTVFEPYEFRSNNAVLGYFRGGVDGHRWWFAIDTGWPSAGMATVPVEYCPWCGRRLGGDAG